MVCSTLHLISCQSACIDIGSQQGRIQDFGKKGGRGGGGGGPRNGLVLKCGPLA